MANLVGMNSCDLRGGIFESPQDRKREEIKQSYIRYGMSPEEAERNVRTVMGEGPTMTERVSGLAGNVAGNVASVAGRVTDALNESPEERQARLAQEQERERRVQWYMSQGMGRNDAESEVKVDYGELDPAFSRRNLKSAAMGAVALGGLYALNKYGMPIIDKKNTELQAKYL